MSGRRAATAAHDPYPEILYELGQRGRHRLRLERIHRLADSGIEWKARVWNHRQWQCRVLGQVTHWLPHVLRTGRAIQSDHIDIERLERGHRAGDVGAEQHAATYVERDLRLYRNPPTELREQRLDSRD